MYRRLLYLNGIAILFVVLYHATGWGFTAMFWWTDRYLPVSVPNFDQFGGPNYYALRAIEQLIIFAIPAFLFVSGFFVAFASGRNRSTIGWDVVFTRIKNLLIPFLLWSVLTLGLDMLLGRTFTALEFVETIVLGQSTPAFYFVPVLIQLYLLSPFLVPLARTRWKLLLVVAGLIHFSVVGLRYLNLLGLDIPILEPFLVLTRSWLFPGYLFWFTFGIVTGLHLNSFKPFIQRVKWLMLAAAGILFFVGLYEWEMLLRGSGQDWISPSETIVDNLYAGALLLAYLGFDQVLLPLAKRMEQLGARSFGIYLSHSLVLTVVAKAVYHLTPWMLQYQIIFIPVLVVLGLGIPLALTEIMDRSPARKYYSYVFG